MSDLNIVLLGKNLTENSRVGNIILGNAAFQSEAPPADAGLHIKRHRGKLKDRDITVINAPHLLLTNLSDSQITHGVKECVNLSAPGLHVIILVLQQNDFSDKDRNRVKYLLNEFSEDAFKHTIVLTNEEQINNNCIRQLIQECGGRHLQFDKQKTGLHSEVHERVEKLNEEKIQFLIRDLGMKVKGTLKDEEQSRSGGSVRAEEDNDDGKKDSNKEKQEIQSKTLCEFC